MTYLQIYNEGISDLLRPERTGLLIREDRKRGLYVENGAASGADGRI